VSVTGPGTRHAATIALLLAGALVASSAGAADLSIAAEGGFFGMTNASKSAKAVFDGSSGGATFGGSLRLGLGRRFFVGVSGRHFSKQGERVFVADATAPVFRLGHPLELRTTSFNALVGYRFMPEELLVPYVALGFGVTSFQEESTVGGLREDFDQSKASGLAAVGLEVGRGRLRLGVELAYSTVPDTVGLAGVSRIYDEKDVGGLSAVGRIIFVP
jgi:hypothetical protein